MIIELIEYAPDYIKSIAKEKAPGAKAYAMFVMYNDDSQRIELRDRTDEMLPAVMGMAMKTGKWNLNTLIVDKTGSDLSKYGFKPRGAEYHQNYRIILA